MIDKSCAVQVLDNHAAFDRITTEWSSSRLSLEHTFHINLFASALALDIAQGKVSAFRGGCYAGHTAHS